jgi:hypothetical protein
VAPAADDRREQRKPGYRIGPFILVPEFRTSADDPWAHRKGEPRLLALAWAMYLMGAALTTIFAVRSLGAPTPDRYSYGCRAMVIIVVVGLTVLWPMTRLSQAGPSRPVRATVLDLFAILAPVQAVIWPMAWLTNWWWDVVAGLNLMVAGWAVLAGSIVARGCASGSVAVRAGLTALAVALVGWAPALSLVSEAFGTPDLPGWWGLLSPLTATLALTAAPGNQSVGMSAGEWIAAGVPLVLGVALLMWAGAGRRGRGGVPNEARPSG